MASIDRASLDQAARGPRRMGFLSSIGGPQFIVAQFFTILATVLGVYLAGYVGFQRTLEYDRFVKAQEQTNLIQSLRAELRHNTARLRAFVPLMEKTQEGHAIYGDWPKLHLFIWRASAENPTVFATPPQTLADMQAFYEEIGQMLSDASIQEMFRRLTTSNVHDRKVLTERFDAKVKFAETTLLPALQATAARSETLVQQYTGASQ